MRKFLVLLMLVFVFDLRAVEVFKGFSLNGDVVFYFQGGNLSESGKIFPSSEKGFGNVIDVEGFYRFTDAFSIYTRFHNGNGQGADKTYSDFLFANINTMADDNPDGNYDLKLLEAYLDVSFFSEKLEIIVGKTEPFVFIDQNEFANDELNQFVGKPFVNNVFFDVEDLYSPIAGFFLKGERVEFSGFVQSIEKHKVFFNGEEWTVDETGTHTFKENLTAGFQVNFKTDFKGLKGNYRFYLYNNSHPHFSVFENLTDGSRRPELKGASGFGVSIDQYFNKRAGLFFRYGRVRKDIYQFRDFYSFGFNVTSMFFKDDCLLFGFAKINPISGLELKDENHIEVQYRLDFKNNLALSFDFQYISNLINYPKLNLSVFTVRVARFF